MGDVYDGDVRIDFQNDALERPDQMIVRSVVGGESNDGPRCQMVLPSLGKVVVPG